jgi:hypothetical protein
VEASLLILSDKFEMFSLVSFDLLVVRLNLSKIFALVWLKLAEYLRNAFGLSLLLLDLLLLVLLVLLVVVFSDRFMGREADSIMFPNEGERD